MVRNDEPSSGKKLAVQSVLTIVHLRRNGNQLFLRGIPPRQRSWIGFRLFISVYAAAQMEKRGIETEPRQ
ncbi:hypothetical protein BWI89_28015 (plasmid) [Escherichia coli]|nr:hypothetical protein BWI89_28015 [Escherichia coli]